jgi:lipoprotein-anchoring transpeptidase ErfK/SrfK
MRRAVYPAMLSRWASFALGVTLLRAGSPSIDPASVNNPGTAALAEGAKGPGVLRAQILLSRAHYSCGEIDGVFGSNFRKALNAFQGERKLPVTGTLDAATWAAINGDAAPALVEYAIAPDDVKGPFVPVPAEVKQQAKLPSLGYASPLEALSEKFHASPQAMQALNPGADFGRAGQQLMVPNVLVMPPGQAAHVVVSRGESSVRAYDASGALLAFYVATIGSEHDPLPLGEWKIKGVARNPKFHFNPDLFWDAKKSDDKATLPPGPNNPVGDAWIDLSKDHYGIHGTPEPGKVGHAVSHGCIRLTNWDVLELAAMVRPGTPATLQE